MEREEANKEAPRLPKPLEVPSCTVSGRLEELKHPPHQSLFLKGPTMMGQDLGVAAAPQSRGVSFLWGP